VLCNGPEAEVSEELCEGGGLVVGVEAAGVGEDPGVAAAEGGLRDPLLALSRVWRLSGVRSLFADRRDTFARKTLQTGRRPKTPTVMPSQPTVDRLRETTYA
jgi:hypothetical protein